MTERQKQQESKLTAYFKTGDRVEHFTRGPGTVIDVTDRQVVIRYDKLVKPGEKDTMLNVQWFLQHGYQMKCSGGTPCGVRVILDFDA